MYSFLILSFERTDDQAPRGCQRGDNIIVALLNMLSEHFLLTD